MNSFNLRIYGILIDSGNLLVTDEFRMNTLMTKFPGGALHFGEGTIDCLKREFIEELNQPIEIIRHFYTTDYYQPTALIPETQQLISIYYLVKAILPYTFQTTDKKFDFPELIDGAQTFRWLPLSNLNISEFTLPIDKKVAELIIKESL
jgi:8-oxo-dGTP diphosphatase